MYSIAIDPHTASAIVIASGTLGAKDARDAAATLWSQPDWGGRSVVWDFRAASFDLSASEVREIAAFILENQPPKPPARVAFVTGRDADFGMARMFQVFREDPSTEFRVFRDYDAAVAWAQAPEANIT